ncbi:hypothetical protein CspeluHIS016_0103290 [Cutaneotrichosporon spelunceum]|uniref:Uncharacterized protein n=1 Tax=Cutaneotrichosporon spelunceum TaxID=1672016 RepID=A0AAD3TMI9_9TREE|nr:hypothetical protein CspeluHIS016_0103290 [Cutaneotrichosporon spelunceum]
MAFQDRGQSVSSLLALLRSAQDGDDEAGEGAAGPASVAGSSANPRPSQPAPPRNSELSALLAQLAPSLPVPAAPVPSTSSAQSAPHCSGFAGPSHNLLEPFGPVGQPVRRDRDSEQCRATDDKAKSQNKGKRKADEMEEADRDEWTFTRCLPALTELLRDDEFVKELRKMKKDQDALERRLWARMEKIKAEHKAREAPDLQIAKITRKPVPPEKVAQWERGLKAALKDLFVRQVLPSLDGLEVRQAARLAQLGVPGLGGKGEARKVRVRRIMGVLEGALD